MDLDAQPEAPQARGGDSWRWYPNAHPAPRLMTIAVIEPASPSYDEYADARERKARAHRVSFGFARALEPPAQQRQQIHTEEEEQ